MKQIARNLTDIEDEFLKGFKHLILERDPLYTAAFRTMLERFVLSIKSKCLDHLIPMNEDQLRRAVRQCMAHDSSALPRREVASRVAHGSKSTDC
jgi:hypothetical protein